MLNGILVVDKPTDWTSFDVIAKLRGVLATRKIGHSGTLDPMATGVLPLFVGLSARGVDMQQNHTKRYTARVLFGKKTDTGDISGTVLQTSDKIITKEMLCAVLPHFVGKQMQLPPMYSAVKVHGQPLYKLARQGKEIERTAREIEILELNYISQIAQNEYEIDVLCSKGTYVRVLLEQLGEALCCPATMSALRRTQSGDYTQSMAYTLQQIYDAAQQNNLQKLLIPVDTVFNYLPSIQADSKLAMRMHNGAPTKTTLANGSYRLYYNNDFLGIADVCDGICTVNKLFVERP